MYYSAEQIGHDVSSSPSSTEIGGLLACGTSVYVSIFANTTMVKFEARSLELTHHHTFGHDVLVIKGRKKVWNLDENESYELGEVDYLFAPVGDKHRVMYFTWFFIRWDGDWDIFQDKELEAAASAIKVEIEGSN
ncbi:DNA-damage-repair/toleration protein DRT102 [Platanthera zijinensis]|uniref:DNA-damage-repair/toleration protein DRT102 n=1 Tax=Platanthera zijinensis TaxID=2320716 RepID=A0AAP0B3K2_9ASPA